LAIYVGDTGHADFRSKARKPLIKDLVEVKNVIATRGSTYENRENLAGVF
jgi:hypothetical protein